jgi:hypothetical protein
VTLFLACACADTTVKANNKLKTAKAPKICFLMMPLLLGLYIWQPPEQLAAVLIFPVESVS